MRLFIALDMPEQIKNALMAIEHELKNIPGVALRGVPRGQLHLTLQFLGEVTEQQFVILKDLLASIPMQPFTVCLGSLGVLTHKEHIRLVYIDLVGNDLAHLAEHIRRATSLLIKTENRSFLSHITLARVAFLENNALFMQALNTLKTPENCFQVDSFVLKESTLSSDGAHHRILQTYKIT